MALKGRAVKRDSKSITSEHATAHKCSVHSGSRTNSNNSTHAKRVDPDTTKSLGEQPRLPGFFTRESSQRRKQGKGWVNAHIERDVERGETVRR